MELPASVISEGLKKQIVNRLENSYHSFHSNSAANYSNLTGLQQFNERFNNSRNSNNSSVKSGGRPVRAKTAGPGVRSLVRYDPPKPEDLNYAAANSYNYNEFVLPAVENVTTQYQPAVTATGTSDFNNTNELVNYATTSSSYMNDVNRVHLMANQADGYHNPSNNYPNFSYETRQSDVVKTVAYRPMTSNLFRTPYNLGDPIGTTHYDETFHKKEINRREPIRTGTSSGNRNNNPHPTQEFMVFRFRPMKTIKNPNSLWSRQIGDKLIEQTIKNQMKSTYASDYVNNVDAKAKFDEEAKHLLHKRPPVLKKSKHAPVDPAQFDSFVYNHPFTHESLHIAPTRYGCNKLHQKAAVGIVPGCPSFLLNLH